MEINWIFNFWDSLFAFLGIAIGTFVSIFLYKISNNLSEKEKWEHEKRITEEIQKYALYENVILADVSKYIPSRIDTTNKTYYKQGAELYTVIPEFGVQFILRLNDENIPVGIIPFEWIQYVRDYDSEDNKTIIVCKFKGIKWYKKFKSPFKEINYVYENPNYNEGADPEFLKFTRFNSK